MKDKIIKALKRGIPAIPLNEDKTPRVRWKDFKISDVERLDNIKAIGLRMGDGVEAIDFDLKYDLTGVLYNRFKADVMAYDPLLIDKMTIQKTINNGYHWIYRCNGITEGNLKLARRKATPEEEKEGEKVKVLIETRGNNGYIVISPTAGYELLSGKISNPNEITLKERNFLFSTAKSFNEYNVEKDDYIPIIPEDSITPLDDYDSRTTPEDIIHLLESHGWTRKPQQGNKIPMKRAGNSTAPHSGYYELDKNRFSVFSTSTDFEPERRYKNSAVYAVLECNGDFHKAAKELSEIGFGLNKKSTQKKLDSDGGVLDIKEGSDLSIFTVPYSEIWDIVEESYDGKIQSSYKTGMDVFDNFFRYRKNALTTFLAKTNVGKTVIVQYLQVLGSCRNNLKWLIWSAENDDDEYAESLLGYYLKGDPKVIRESDPDLYLSGKKFVEAHFYFLNEATNLEDVMMITKAFYLQYNIFALFIDPINSTAPNKRNENWDYSEMVTAGRKVKEFTKRYCSVWISVHPRIGAQREKGVPSSVDVEFGALINKADIGVVFDRDKESHEHRNTTIMKIDKVRAKRRGGETTPENIYIHLYYYGFTFKISAPDIRKNGTVVRVKYNDPFSPSIKEDDSENLEIQSIFKTQPSPPPNDKVTSDTFIDFDEI